MKLPIVASWVYLTREGIKEWIKKMEESKTSDRVERAKIFLEEREETEKLIKGNKKLLEAIGRL